MPRRLRLQPSKAQEVTSDGFAVLTEGAQYRAPADPPPTPLLYAHQNPAAILTEKRVAWEKKKKKIKTHQNLYETGENLQKVLRSQPWWRGGDTRGQGKLICCCGLRRLQWISHSKQFSQAASIFKAQTAITALFQQQKWTGESADGQRASLRQSPGVCSCHLRWVITEDSGASSDTVVPSSPVLYTPPQRKAYSLINGRELQELKCILLKITEGISGCSVPPDTRCCPAPSWAPEALMVLRLPP